MSRGKRTTRIHVVVNGLGNLLEFLLRRENDSIHAIELLRKINRPKSNILGEKAYASSKSICEYITE